MFEKDILKLNIPKSAIKSCINTIIVYNDVGYYNIAIVIGIIWYLSHRKILNIVPIIVYKNN